MKIIDHDDIVDMNLDPLLFFEWIEESFSHKVDSILPAKIHITLPDNRFFNFMPCVIPELDIMGIKNVNRYPTRTPALDSQIMIYDYSTGTLKAIIDGNFITTMRTGAVAAHSIGLFAKKNAETIGIMGLGNTARATLDILLRMYPSRKFRIKLLKYKGQEKSFADRYKDNENVEFCTCDNYDDLVSDSDVLLSCVTYLSDDVCTEEKFPKGCTVIPVHTRGFMCCDTTFDKVFVADTNHVKGFKNFNEFKNLTEVISVVNGEKKGRESDEERILVYNVGISLHDMFFAWKIMNMVNSTKKMEMLPPTKKHWV